MGIQWGHQQHVGCALVAYVGDLWVYKSATKRHKGCLY